MTRPTFLSLFSGIGGLDLGLERAGWECVGQVENDPYCTRVLAKHWPDVPRWGDIKELDPDELPRADLICGGFPCQPVSLAGQRRGQDDPRWLWPEFHRLVRALRPRWVLVENVPGLLVRGMGDVLGDLATSGYDAEWFCLSAADVGAPHLRERVWITARAQQRRPLADPGGGWRPGDELRPGRHVARLRREAVAHPEGFGGQLRTAARERPGRPASGGVALGDTSSHRRGPRLRQGTGGFDVAKPGDPGWWATEPDVGRVAHGVPARLDRLRALGNAVVPQVAELIGRRILEAAA